MNTIYEILMQSALTSSLAIKTIIFLFIPSLIIGTFVIPHTIGGMCERQKLKGNPTVIKPWVYIIVMQLLFTAYIGVFVVVALFITNENSRNASNILQTENWEITEAVEINGMTTITIKSPEIKGKKMESFLGKTVEVTVKKRSITAILTERDIHAIKKSNQPVARVNDLKGALAKNLDTAKQAY